MLKIGITGGIGSGKSYVCRLIEAKGYPVFYSDQVSKDLTKTDPEIRKSLIDLLGEQVYLGAELNRAWLAKAIFGNQEILANVNAIIHPKVRKAFDHFCKQATTPLVFNEAAILIETSAYQKFDGIVLVTAPEEVRITRVMRRDGVSREAVLERMDRQWTDAQKRPHANIEIINDGKCSVEKQVENMLAYFTSSQGSKSS
jgi:dephospho-CoA kinase